VDIDSAQKYQYNRLLYATKNVNAVAMALLNSAPRHQTGLSHANCLKRVQYNKRRLLTYCNDNKSSHYSLCPVTFVNNPGIYRRLTFSPAVSALRALTFVRRLTLSPTASALGARTFVHHVIRHSFHVAAFAPALVTVLAFGPLSTPSCSYPNIVADVDHLPDVILNTTDILKS
jgi:hypothetical protein